MNAVANIKPHIASIRVPDQLASLPGWLVWRYEHHEGEPKPRKVPYYTNGGKRHGIQGRPEDRQHLTTLEAAKAAAARRGFDGVGLALMPDWGVVALDFDHCLVDGKISDEVERLVAGTYAEWSPSGEGVRAFMVGNLGNNKDLSDQTFGFETFSSKGFVTVTGNRLDITEELGAENTLAAVSHDVIALCKRRFDRAQREAELDDPLMSYEPPVGLTVEQIREALDVLDADCSRQQWRDLGMAIHHETEGKGFSLWHEWSKRGTKYPGERAILEQWKSFGRSDGRQITARTLLKLAKEHGAYISTATSPASLAEAAALPDAPSKFQVVPAAQFATAKPQSWLIKNVLPRGELVVLFGESGAGKSFFALDMGAAIARNIDWRGHRTQKGRVVYIAAEGAGGFRKRLAAYAKHHGIELATLDLGIIHAAPNLLDKGDAVAVARAIAATGPCDLVIVDTFAQVMPGANENAGEDVGKALAHCKGIHLATGATVLLIHHAGKDTSKGARGWSGLKAAADAEIEVLRLPNGRMARISKQKDGEDNLEWGFDLHTVPVGIDDEGDVIDSCVVIESEIMAIRPGSVRRRFGPWEQLVVDALGALGESPTVDDVVNWAASNRAAPEPGKRDTRKFQARRALMGLCEGDEAPFWVDGDRVVTM